MHKMKYLENEVSGHLDQTCILDVSIFHSGHAIKKLGIGPRWWFDSKESA